MRDNIKLIVAILVALMIGVCVEMVAIPERDRMWSTESSIKVLDNEIDNIEKYYQLIQKEDHIIYSNPSNVEALIITYNKDVMSYNERVRDFVYYHGMSELNVPYKLEYK